MKGSDKWGQGNGPKLELVLAALVVASLVGVYLFYVEGSRLNSRDQGGAIATVSTTGVGCDSDSIPPAAQRAQQDPAFTDLSNGLCYNYIGESPGVLTFAYYNGTITYPCGDAPVQLPESEILVNVTAAQEVVSARLVAPSETAVQGEACGPSMPVNVVSVQDVESTIPAVPQLNVTLAVPSGGRSVAILQAVITLDGGSQTFKFAGVTSARPLAALGSASSVEIVLTNLSFSADEVYPMTISGTFDNGQTFGQVVHVQVSRVP
jgi:hypothetical protein